MRHHMYLNPRTLYIFNGRWVAQCFKAADLQVLESLNFIVAPHLSNANTTRNREAIVRRIAAFGGDTVPFEMSLKAAPRKRRAPIFTGTDAGGAFILQSSSKALGSSHREKVYPETPEVKAALTSRFRLKRRRLDGSSQKEGERKVDHASEHSEAARLVNPRGLSATVRCANKTPEPKPKRKQALRQCQEDACTKKPTFGKTGGRPLYCQKHRLDGMIDVVTRLCEAPDCSRTDTNLRKPIYALPGEPRGRFCTAHKLAGMVNVACCRCTRDGCSMQISVRGGLCKAHKTIG